MSRSVLPLPSAADRQGKLLSRLPLGAAAVRGTAVRGGAALAFAALCLLSFVLPFALSAAPVSVEQAKTAAANWVRQSRSLDRRLGGSVVSATTYTATNGAPFHVVKLGTGFVVTTGDTSLDPVIVHSSGDDLEPDERNPLWVLVRKDIALRAQAAGLVAGVAQKKLNAANGTSGTSATQSAAERRWATLLAEEATSAATTNGAIRKLNAALPSSSLTDIRVEPLVQSAWGQDTIWVWTTDGWDEVNVFNCYTPNNYCCGCVATAGAQIMRYFEWPKDSRTPFTCNYCAVDDVITSLTTQGGIYDWANMPLNPSDDITDQECQAISKLTSDIGICCGMGYAEEGSGTGGYMLKYALTTHFGYSNAVAMQHHYEDCTTEDTRNALLSNFDAGLPVAVSIDGEGGHEIVGDGYGYSDETLYYHLNMGWDGSNDAWYAPPDLSAGGYNFSILDGFVYNIYTNETAGAVICSGRVLDSDGNPVAGVTVKASQSGTVKNSVASNEKGIYALILPAGTYTLTAQGAKTSASRSVTLSACQSVGLCDDPSKSNFGSYYPTSTQSVGNLCEQDLTLPKAATIEVKFTVTPYMQHPATDAMTVLFFTDKSCDAMVKCWPANAVNPEAVMKTLTATCAVASDLGKVASDETPAWGTQYKHRVRFTELESGETYRYAVELASGESYTNTFSTAPGMNTPVRFVAYSDSETIPPTYRDNDRADANGCTTQWEVKGRSGTYAYYVSRSVGFASNLLHMAEWKPNLYVIAGDLAARGGVQMFWDEFWKENAGGLGRGYGDPGGSVPILAVTGNHDLYDNENQSSLSSSCNNNGETGLKKYLSYFEFNENGVDYTKDTSEKGNTDKGQLFHREDYGPVTLRADASKRDSPR